LLLILILIVVVAVALVGGLAVAGFRDGDRPGDAAVAAELIIARQPDGARPVIRATVANRSAVPVMVGLRARRSLTAGALTARVPWRTRARRYRAGEQDTVGVVLGWESAIFAVPVRTAARRYRLTAVVGQSGRRLRVLTLPVTGTPMMERVVKEACRDPRS
jgi:hypothetical protein